MLHSPSHEHAQHRVVAGRAEGHLLLEPAAAQRCGVDTFRVIGRRDPDHVLRELGRLDELPRSIDQPEADQPCIQREQAVEEVVLVDGEVDEPVEVRASGLASPS